MRRLIGSAGRLAERAPKLVAGVWFGLWAFVAVATIFLRFPMRGGLLAVFSSIVLPTVTAGLVGSLYGSSILDHAKTRNYRQAFGRALLLMLWTFLVFAPLLVLFHVLTAQRGFPGVAGLAAMSVFVLIAEVLKTFPVVLGVTTIGALTLFELGKHDTRPREAENGGKTR